MGAPYWETEVDFDARLLNANRTALGERAEMEKPRALECMGSHITTGKRQKNSEGQGGTCALETNNIDRAALKW